MKIMGTEFDDPREFPLSPRDMAERKEGARTTVKEMWVCSYRKEGSGVGTSMQKLLLTMTNRGACTFEGRPVKDEAEKKLIAELFATVKPV